MEDWEYLQVICSTAYVTDCRWNGLFTFPVIATEKLESRNKFQKEVGPTCKTYPGLKHNR